MSRPNLKLLSRYLSSRCTPAERHQAEEWINSSSKNKVFFDRLRQVWEISARTGDELPYSRPLGKLSAMMERTERGSGTGTEFRLFRIGPLPRMKRLSLNAAFGYAAVFVLLLGTFYAARVLKDKALERKMRSQGETSALKEVSTNQCQQMTLNFSDGTKIVLNSAGHIKYSDQSSGPRNVYLDGEAYFQVAHSDYRPLIIHVHNETIEDIGTKFNVKAWNDDENARVAVIDGKVSIHPDAQPARELVVTRSQYCVVNSDGVVVPPTYTDVARDIEWLRGKLVFHDASMSEVIEQVRRRYGIYCLVADTSILSRRITTTFDERDPPKRVVSIIAVTLDLTCKVSGDSVLFMDSRRSIPKSIFPQNPIEKQP